MPDPNSGAQALLSMPMTNGFIWELMLRFALNLIVAFTIIRYSYWHYQKNATYAFTFYLFNVLIFFVCYLLSSVTLSIGFAFGLFAVFAILRYRTRPIPIKEMTYLFMVITVGVMNALSTPDIGIIELLFANAAIVTVALTAEHYWNKNYLYEMRINYEKIENIPLSKHDILLKDLKERTGLEIVKFEIKRISFLRDTARIKIFFRQESSQG